MHVSKYACVCSSVLIHECDSVSGSLLQHGLPLRQSLSDGEAGDHAVDLGSPLAHVVLNVKHKGLLAEVSIHDLPRGLQPHRGVQVRLRPGKMEDGREKSKKSTVREREEEEGPETVKMGAENT